MTHGKLVVFAVFSALAAIGAAGCTSSGPGGGPSGGPRPTEALVAARLTAFSSCDAAVAGLRRAAEASVGPGGLPTASGSLASPSAVRSAAVPGDAAGTVPGPSAAAAAAPAAAGAAANGAAATSGTGTAAFSGTNTYVPGVDEPDLVKTDGHRIVTLSGSTLEVVDAASRQLTGRLELSTYGVTAGAANLLLSGDHLLLLSNGTPIGGGPVPVPASAAGAAGGGAGSVGETGAPITYGPRLLLIDLTGYPRVLSSYSIEGSLVDARQVGSAVRVVTGSVPHIVFPAPVPGVSGTAMTAANRAVIAAAGAGAWLPHYISTTGGATLTGRISCERVSHPVVYSGANLLTVLTFDLSASSLGSGDGVSIAADGGTVYGTASSLYVASGNQWERRPVGTASGTNGVTASDFDAYGVRQATEVYRFAIDQQGPPRYVASAIVPGYLVNQYAMSEWGGYLRIATTTGTSWSLADGRPQGAQQSLSAVYVLTTAGPVMRLVGGVSGLGAGERIYSVRFEGPVGYVVTFRQTDPLYTLDLSDPGRPHVVGTLDLTGYSAYLHPVSGTQLIGIGQQADLMGHKGGTQVSLFDVADLAAPQLLSTFALSHAHSAAEFNPHAFLYWPAAHLVVVPIQLRYPAASPPVPGAGGVATGTQVALAPSDGPGALVLRIDSGAISQAGFIRQPVTSGGYWGPAIERSLVIGNTLWTVSSAGLLASDLSTLRQQAWVPFDVTPTVP
jgi:hypothetical protein